MSKLNPQIGLNKDELQIVKNAFDLFDPEHTGKADIKEIKETLLNIGYDQKNPILFQIISDLDTPEAAKNGGVSFFDLIDDINTKLLDKNSKEALSNLYSIFVDDTNSIRKETLKEICDQIGKEYDDATLQESLDKLVKFGTDLTYEEFESIILRRRK